MATSAFDHQRARSAAFLRSDDCILARRALRWSRLKLAAAAGVSENAISRIENDRAALPNTAGAVRAALEAAGIVFVAEDCDEPRVLLRKQVHR